MNTNFIGTKDFNVTHKMIGILNSKITDYQKGNLDCRAKKMVLPTTIKEMMIKALPFAVVPFTVIFYLLKK